MEQRPNQRVDPNYPRRFSSYLNEFLIKSEKYVGTHVKFIGLRLPSVILADVILANSNYLIDYLDMKILHDMNHILVYLVSKFIFMTLLFGCLLLFTLTPNNVLRIYKIIGLISQPFLFSYFLSLLPTNEILIHSIKIPRLILVTLLYTIILSLTSYFYYEIYYKFLIDKYEIHRYYQLYNDRGEESHFLELLTNNGYKNLPYLIRVDHEVQGRLNELDHFLNETNHIFDPNNRVQNNFRRFFIFSFYLLSFIFNDLSVKENRDERLNFISLGYLSLLFYDLMTNLDQMLLRLLLRIKILARLITQEGFQHFLSFSWFERFRVPFMLKSYFFVKILIFTLNFMFYSDYYCAFDEQIRLDNSHEKNSLFFYIKSLFIRKSETDLNETHENYMFTTIYSQFISLFYQPNIQYESIDTRLVSKLNVYTKFLILNQTCTMISILCTTIVISYKFHLIGLGLKKLIKLEYRSAASDNPDDIRNVGEVAAILFFLLSLQSSITTLSGQERIEKFYRNYSLLFIAVLHYFHSTVDYKLNVLGTSPGLPNNKNQHSRTLIISAFMILIPGLIVFFIWKWFSVSTWLLSTTAFNVELIVKMLVSLMLYLLYTIDSRRVSNFENESKKNEDTEEKYGMFDRFDDYIYYIRAFGHVFEFIVAIFLFINGGYVLVFESYGVVRALMMCIHAYFHIWCQASKGWKSFIHRRLAMQKFKNFPKFNKNSFLTEMKKKYPDKNENQFEQEYEEKRIDKCSICWDEIKNQGALIMKCDHIFHYRCARRWLYQETKCPMCKKDAFTGEAE